MMDLANMQLSTCSLEHGYPQSAYSEGAEIPSRPVTQCFDLSLTLEEKTSGVFGGKRVARGRCDSKHGEMLPR